MRVLKWAGWLLLALVVLTAILVASIGQFKGPLTRAISNATGRELVIDGDLRVVFSLIHPRFRAERVTFANAEWGQYDYMLQADAIEASVSLLGLLRGRLVVPEVHLEGAALALEMDEEGRKSWILRKGDDEDEDKKESRIFIRQLTLDNGRLLFEDAAHEISLAADLETDASGVAFKVEGTYQGNPASLEGHGGPVLSLRDTDRALPPEGQGQDRRDHHRARWTDHRAGGAARLRHAHRAFGQVDGRPVLDHQRRPAVDQPVHHHRAAGARRQARSATRTSPARSARAISPAPSSSTHRASGR